MVRTRDFLLYILVFVFIVLGISFTISTERSKQSSNKTTTETIETFAGKDKVDAVIDGEIDRDSNLAALRAKLAKGEGEIIQGAPVFTSVDTPTSTGSPIDNTGDSTDINQDAILEPSSRHEQFCVAQSYPDQINSWPKSGVTIKEVEGARLVLGLVASEVVAGSSTEMKMTEKNLIQLPMWPNRTLSSNCLDSEYIGVALDGSLIKNSETWRFRNIPDESLIGYARDGHPIYGAGTNETLLDTCGGYDTGAGYRYYLREKELFILGCFAAPPQPFLE